mmetsp:Transcript_32609/g.75779  ORF Transcript_32609/g.75779 Transcript_32609/m.75779 type:complete len:257 (+) Transcript_32609:195-965(+)
MSVRSFNASRSTSSARRRSRYLCSPAASSKSARSCQLFFFAAPDGEDPLVRAAFFGLTGLFSDSVGASSDCDGRLFKRSRRPCCLSLTAWAFAAVDFAFGFGFCSGGAFAGASSEGLGGEAGAAGSAAAAASNPDRSSPQCSVLRHLWQMLESWQNFSETSAKPSEAQSKLLMPFLKATVASQRTGKCTMKASAHLRLVRQASSEAQRSLPNSQGDALNPLAPCGSPSWPDKRRLCIWKRCLNLGLICAGLLFGSE